jgi:hypothetical protein
MPSLPPLDVKRSVELLSATQRASCASEWSAWLPLGSRRLRYHGKAMLLVLGVCAEWKPKLTVSLVAREPPGGHMPNLQAWQIALRAI